MADANSTRESSRLAAVFDRTFDNSRFVGALRAPFQEGSRADAAARGFSDTVRSSYLFRWLTAEPEPEVIVIDLRETWTVGPFVALLDRLAPHAVRTWDGSSSRQTLYRATDLFRSGPVQLTSGFVLGILLANLVLAWGSLGPVSLAFQLFLAAPALLGLRVDWTWDELTESKVGQLASSLLVPPEQLDEETR